MKILLFLLILGTCRGSSNESVLQLLVVLNVQGGPEVPRWDRGLEILPAAQMAVEKINGDHSILPGYQLELVQVDTGTCTHNFHSEGLINFVHQITQEENHIVGVVGLFCTTVTQLLSPLAGHQGINLLHISGSASPALHNQEKFPYLWHMIPSSTAYVDAVLEMMDAFEWRNIAVLGAPGGLYYQIAKEFTLKQYENTSRLATLPIHDTQVSSALRDLRHSGKRIVFASVEAKVTAQMICQAYQEGLVWPDYAWILPDHHIDDLLFHADDVCDIDVLRRALERVYFLQFHFDSNDTHTQYNTTHTQNPYTNVMHDSIQAFALSLNKTVGHLQAMNLSLEDYRLGNSDITDMIEKELMALSFTGTLGHVQFDPNKREQQTTVDILQIRNATATQMGSYNPVTGQLVLDQEVNPIQDVQSTEIPQILKHIPFPVAGILFTGIGMGIILTTIIFVLFIYYRKSAEIKATSFKLSLLMFLGCYLLLISTIFNTVSELIDLNQGPFLCNSVTWCASLGINFVFGTLFVRMLRIYRIFNYFGKLGRKKWSDRVLFIVVLLIVGIEATLLLTWSLVDVFTIRKVETYQAAASPPYNEVVQFCSCNYLQTWLTLVVGEVGILMFAVAFLAFKTRKIRRQHFKDTKKVNVYLFINILLICTVAPLWFVLRTSRVNDPTSGPGTIVLNIGYAGTATLCQLLLFAPKVIPPLTRQLFHKTGNQKLCSQKMCSRSISICQINI